MTSKCVETRDFNISTEVQEATLRSLMRSPFSSKAMDPESSARQRQSADIHSDLMPPCVRKHV